MFKIGEFSKLTKITIKALRYYDRLGLLKPAFKDDFTRYRYYTEEQIQIAQTIQNLKDIGMPCEKIQQMLKKDNDSEKILNNHKKELENKKAEIEEQLKKLNFLTHNTKGQKYAPFFEHIDSCMVYCSRSYIKDVNHINDFIKLTFSELKKTNPEVGFPSPDYCCIIYPGNSYRETNIFVEYVQSVDKKGIDTNIIAFKTLKAIDAISVTHYGSYENIRDAYTSAVSFALANGYKICGNPRERYLKGAWNCEKTEDWETVVQLPVSKGENS
ncbi:MAG: MerR family transcriptional regulator [Ruminococcaceae bacterium]|nr:MerR family transcriptional regulator [Oscillospiraceae bacterium]